MSLIRNQLIRNIFKSQLRVLSTVTSAHQNNAESRSNETFFPGARAPWCYKVDLKRPTVEDISNVIPIYRVIDDNGVVLHPEEDPNLSQDVITKMFRDMVLLNTMDKILYESQRQGRISFYMTNFGEEASHIGSAAGLLPEDLVYAQYREAGVLVWRGFTISDFINQCFGNIEDLGKGRQMPVHYGSKKLNFFTISSPLATQISQAVGAAYAQKLKPNNKACTIVYFGEGAASEGDTHAAFNFAATLRCPVIFFCRNNGFAISTPSSEQYKGDGIAGRASGYGMAALRVDGTDTLAVYNGIKAAREYVLKNNKPIIFEAMSYRVGHHSTSDDSTAYRSVEDIEIWNTQRHPITKLKNYMVNKNWFIEEEENAYVKSVRNQVLSQITLSEKILKHDWREMFHDVYHDIPEHLQEQMGEMEEHLSKYKEHYSLKDYQS